MKRERLFERIPHPRPTHGISGQDIARITVDSNLVNELVDCLQSNDSLDAIFGLWFVEHLSARLDFCVLAEPSFPLFASLVRNALTHADRQVREAAIGAFVALRENYDGYPAVMRELLRSADPDVRRSALRAALTFLSAEDLETLLPFRDDPFFGETGGMGGPLRYDLRDYALEVAEDITGQRFDSGDCLEQREGATISWRSWSAFTRWLEIKKKWKFFGSAKRS
jgi:hypothetical protein